MGEGGGEGGGRGGEELLPNAGRLLVLFGVCVGNQFHSIVGGGRLYLAVKGVCYE